MWRKDPEGYRRALEMTGDASPSAHPLEPRVSMRPEDYTNTRAAVRVLRKTAMGRFLYEAGHDKGFWCTSVIWPVAGICRIVTAEDDAGRRQQIGARIFRNPGIASFIARIGGEITRVAELRRVDEQADDDDIGKPPRHTKQRHVSVVERSHRGKESDSPGRADRVERLHGAERDADVALRAGILVEDQRPQPQPERILRADADAPAAIRAVVLVDDGHGPANRCVPL